MPLTKFPLTTASWKRIVTVVSTLMGCVLLLYPQLTQQEKLFGQWWACNPLHEFFPKGTDFTAVKEHNQMVRYAGLLFVNAAIIFGVGEIGCALATSGLAGFGIEYYFYGTKIGLGMAIFQGLTLLIGCLILCPDNTMKRLGEQLAKYRSLLLCTCVILSTYDVNKFGYNAGWWEVPPKNPTDQMNWTFGMINAGILLVEISIWFYDFDYKSFSNNHGLPLIASGWLMLATNYKFGRGCCNCHPMGFMAYFLIIMGHVWQYMCNSNNWFGFDRDDFSEFPFPQNITKKVIPPSPSPTPSPSVSPSPAASSSNKKKRTW